MSAYISSKKCRLSYILLTIIICSGFLTAAFFRQLSNHIKEISEFEGRKVCTDLINQAVFEQVSADSETEYVLVERNEDGEITSVLSNTNAVNSVNQKISHSVNDKLKKLEHENINVPVGTLSGITLFTGRGTNIPLRLHQIGAVNTEMKSKFEGTGVNQTKYSLYIEITVEMTAVLPANSTDITVKSQYLVNETIIVGEAPKMYLSNDLNKSK